MNDILTVVVDTGSSTTKAGFAGEAFPRCVFPTAVARFRQDSYLDGIPIFTCGDEAILKRGISKLTYPVQNGMVENFDEMEKLWHHTFYKELYVAPEETKVLHSVHPLVSRQDREKMAEILFENFTVPYLSLVKAPVLAIHASGRTTGVVWENGASCCYVSPVFEGYPLKHATVLSPFCGEKLTSLLAKKLRDRGYSFSTPVDIDVLNKIKEETCYIAKDYEEHNKTYEQSGSKLQYTLPDGQQLLLDSERFQVPEVMFQPSILDMNCPSIVDNIMTSVGRCDMEYHSTFFNNIVISGGTSMLSGIKERLYQEMVLRLVSQPELAANVDAITSRKYTVWGGGSILGSLPNGSFWVNRKEYEDNGPDCVNWKFF